MQTLLWDIRYALRMLRRSPGFAAVTVLTLALGIGATTVTFSLLNAFLLRPLPVEAPERLVSIHEFHRGRSVTIMAQSAVPYQRYLDYREPTRQAFEGLGAQRLDEFSIRTTGPAQVATGFTVSSNYFQLLGLRPALGSFFAPAQDQPGAAEPVAVIGHTLWQERLGGAPGVVGSAIYINGRPFTIAGVAPRGFGGTMPGLQAEVWVPAAADGVGSARTSVTLFGRLRPGVSHEQAAATLKVAGAQVPADAQTEVMGVRVDPLGIPGAVRGGVTAFLGMLLATAMLVLLIAAINIAGMMLARASARRREVAIRLAVGGGRGRLVRQLVTESVVLFLIGGGAGVLLAIWMNGLLAGYQWPLAERVALDLGLDGRVLGFALLVSLVTGILFGLAPALQASNPDLVPALKSGAADRPGRRTRLRSSFVVAQIAMAMLLLVSAGLLVRTLQRALNSDLGFDPEHVVVAGFGLSSQGYDDGRANAFYAQLMERLQGAPGIEAAGLARFAPMNGKMTMRAQPEEKADDPESGAEAFFNVVDTGYFETLRIPLVTGRGFTGADREGGPPVVVVNQVLANRFWPGENPVGKRVRFNGESREVVGLARDGKFVGYREEPIPSLYLPYAQEPSYSNMTLHVRSRGIPDGQVLGTIRREVAALDPNVALEQALPLTTVTGFSLFPQRFAATLIGAFGLVGLVLAAIGVYGILAFHASQRTSEIGVRMALGARARDVVQLVVRQGLVLIVTGIVLGLAAAFAVTRLFASLLYGVSATDPLVFVTVPLLLAAVALLASYIPAYRAARVDPSIALRAE